MNVIVKKCHEIFLGNSVLYSFFGKQVFFTITNLNCVSFDALDSILRWQKWIEIILEGGFYFF